MCCCRPAFVLHTAYLSRVSTDGRSPSSTAQHETTMSEAAAAAAAVGSTLRCSSEQRQHSSSGSSSSTTQAAAGSNQPSSSSSTCATRHPQYYYTKSIKSQIFVDGPGVRVTNSESLVTIGSHMAHTSHLSHSVAYSTWYSLPVPPSAALLD